MTIVHIAPNAPYNEGWGYQENLLPKYQKKLGHDVILIITDAMHKDGKVIATDCCDKMMDDGVRLIRMQSGYTHSRTIIGSLLSYMDVYPILLKLKPDFVFFHGLVSSTIFDVVKYKKRVNSHCVIVQDNHMDPHNGFSSNDIKTRMCRYFYRYVRRLSIPYVDCVYGVTPLRKKYAELFFGVPSTKTDVLIMGADDDSMDYDNHMTHRKSIREKYGISDSDFLIVSGGKLEDNKRIDVLMEACGGLDGVRLLLFGSVDAKNEQSFHSLLEKYPEIIYVGWITATDCYKYFYAADLVCFPGRHSVLWEQACASKVPCLIKHFEGMEHVDVGGNTLLTENETADQYRDTILSLRFTEKYDRMNRIAKSSKTDVFLYSEIAKKSIDDYHSLANK